MISATEDVYTKGNNCLWPSVWKGHRGKGWVENVQKKFLLLLLEILNWSAQYWGVELDRCCDKIYSSYTKRVAFCTLLIFKSIIEHRIINGIPIKMTHKQHSLDNSNEISEYQCCSIIISSSETIFLGRFYLLPLWILSHK